MLFMPVFETIYVIRCMKCSEPPLPQYQNCARVCGLYIGRENCACVSLGWTPLSLLVIMVLCVAISRVMWKMC